MQLPLVFPPLDASNQQVNQCRLVPAQQHLSLPCNTSFTAFILDRESQIQDVCCCQNNSSTFSPHVSAVVGGGAHHNANLFKDQLLCQDDSADDILESFNELTIVRNGDDEVAEVKTCASVCARLCVCVGIFATQQEVSEKITSHCLIMSTKDKRAAAARTLIVCRSARHVTCRPNPVLVFSHTRATTLIL